MSNIFASKTNNAFYQTVFTVIVAVTAMFLLSSKVYQLSGLYLSVLMHKIINACGCADMAQFFSMHPIIFGAVILFGIGIGIFIFYSLCKLAKLISRTKKYTAHYLSFAKAGHSFKLISAIKALDLDRTRIVEINKPDLAVFCFGFWRPRICISRDLIDMLDKNELRAVLLHEAQHMISYEPLKVFIVKYFRNVFFFLPGLKISAKKYITFSELAADEKASETLMARSSLASAILKISERGEYGRQNNSSSLSFFSPLIKERASRLSDAAYMPEFKFLDLRLIFGSIGLILASFLVLLIFSDSTKAFEMYNSNSCILEDRLKNNSACGFMNHQNNLNADNENFYGIDADIFPPNSACKFN